MPFKSSSQRKACYATDGFGGKVNCAEWQKDTPKKLPKHVKKHLRPHKKMAMGGQTGEVCYDANGNVIPCITPPAKRTQAIMIENTNDPRYKEYQEKLQTYENYPKAIASLKSAMNPDVITSEKDYNNAIQTAYELHPFKSKYLKDYSTWNPESKQETENKVKEFQREGRIIGKVKGSNNSKYNYNYIPDSQIAPYPKETFASVKITSSQATRLPYRVDHSGISEYYEDDKQGAARMAELNKAGVQGTVSGYYDRSGKLKYGGKINDMNYFRKRKMLHGGMGGDCPPGYIWSDDEGRCIPSIIGEDMSTNPPIQSPAIPLSPYPVVRPNSARNPFTPFSENGPSVQAPVDKTWNWRNTEPPNPIVSPLYQDPAPALDETGNPIDPQGPIGENGQQGPTMRDDNRVANSGNNLPKGPAQEHANHMHQEEEKKQRKKFDPFFWLRGATTALGWLGNKRRNNEQNQYMQQQYSSLAQNDPINTNDYQPNKFSMYAKYGGSLRKYGRMRYVGGGMTMHPDCPPGTVWNEQMQQCVPIPNQNMAVNPGNVMQNPANLSPEALKAAKLEAGIVGQQMVMDPARRQITVTAPNPYMDRYVYQQNTPNGVIEHRRKSWAELDALASGRFGVDSTNHNPGTLTSMSGMGFVEPPSAANDGKYGAPYVLPDVQRRAMGGMINMLRGKRRKK